MNEFLIHIGPWAFIILLLGAITLPQMARILREYERGVIFRWGKLRGAKGPGLIFLIPFIDRMVRMDLRVVTIDVPKQEIIDRQTDPWGVKVSMVEVRDVVLPDGMKRAMAKQAEAERERRAKVVNAEGEFQAAEKMVQAAAMMAQQPISLQLRFLQTMVEIASEHNTTTFVPLPGDLFGPFMRKSS